MPSLGMVFTGVLGQPKNVERFAPPKSTGVGRLARWRETTAGGGGNGGGVRVGGGNGSQSSSSSSSSSSAAASSTRAGVVTISVDLTTSPRPPADAQGTPNTQLN